MVVLMQKVDGGLLEGEETPPPPGAYIPLERAPAEEGLAEPQAGLLPLEALRPAELIYLDPGSGEGACGR